MSEDVQRKKKISPDELKQFAAAQLQAYRANMAKCRLLQRRIQELEERAKVDVKAQKALNRVDAMLRSTAPTVDALRKRVEKRLEQLAQQNEPVSGQRERSDALRRKPTVDKIL